MTKAEIINKIASRTGVERTDVGAILEAFFKVVKTSMAEGENLYIRGFGSFILKKRAQKVARIIVQNKPIVIEEHYIPSFKPAKIFLDKVKESELVKEKMKNVDLAKQRAEEKEVD